MINIYGKNVIYELFNTKLAIYELYLRDDVFNKDRQIVNKANLRNIKITVLTKEKMNNMFKGLHQGYAARIEDLKTYQLSEVVDKNKKQLFVILDGLEDPNNLGAIMRTCDAFKVDGIIVQNKGNIGLTDSVIKVSTGACFYVPLIVVSNLNQAILKLKQENVWICGADMDGSVPLAKLEFDRSMAVVIGSEGFGIRDLVKKNCDYVTSIPMEGHVNSLNASVSLAIIIAQLKIHLPK